MENPDKDAAIKPGQSNPTFFGVSSLVTILFFCILWRLDFPKPYIDDLFYSSGGLSLAQGTGLDCPHIAAQGIPNSFFVYPPVYSYALAAWLKLFGINSASMTAFQILMYCIVSLATIALVRVRRGAGWIEWCVPLATAAAFLRTGGLRPEAFAIALLMLAVVTLEISFPQKKGLFLFFFLSFLAGATAPRLAIFSVLLMGLATWDLARGFPNLKMPAWQVLPVASAALFTVCLIFLLMIHFRLGEFLFTFRLHATRITGWVHSVQTYFRDEVGILAWPLLGLPFCLMFLSRHALRDRFTRLAVALCVTFVAGGILGSLGPGAIWFCIFASLLLAARATGSVSGWRTAAINGTMLLFLLVANSRTLITVYGELTGTIRRGPGGQAAEALALAASPTNRLFVDIHQARYLFNYRIPAGLLAFEYGAPFPGTYIYTESRPSDVYLIGPQSLDILREQTHLEFRSPPKWSPSSVKRWALDQYPEWTYIVSAKDCGQPTASH